MTKLVVQERPELETTMTAYPAGRVAFTHRNYAVYIVGGDTALRLQAYWHMASNDTDFWGMIGIKRNGNET